MSFLRRLLNLGRDERLSRDIERELSFHLRERVDELVAAGYSEREARQEARRQFGNPTFQRERTRDADIVAWVDSFRGDVRYALRALRRSPAFTTVAVASLALGIGGATSIFTLIDAVVLRPLPVPGAELLVQVTGGDEDRGGYFTNPLWEAIRDRQSGFTAMTAFQRTRFDIGEGPDVRYVSGEWAGGDYFQMFGMQPALGRLPTRADDVRGCPGTAVISEAFWRSEFGGRSNVVGHTLPLNGKPFMITGVVATGRGFSSPEVGHGPQIYVPLCAEAVLRGTASSLDARSNWWLRILARRDPGVSFSEARQRLKTIAPDVYAATVPPRYPSEHQQEYRDRTLGAFQAERGMSEIRDQYTKALTIIMAGVALLLLIASANIANLLLARAAAREREIAVRMAIGAARQRLVRQLVTESLLLALVGAAGGLALAHWGTLGLVALIQNDAQPIALDLALGARVLGFTVLVAVATALGFGLAPAWRGTRVSPQAAMKSGGRGIAEGGHRGFTIGKSLVVAQVALSLTLLVGAGLLVGSLRNLSTMDYGFTPEGVIVAEASYRRTSIPRETTAAVTEELLDRVRALPGVQAAATVNVTPMGGSTWNNAIFVDGYAPSGELDNIVWFNDVSAGYFAAMDVRLLSGRDFDASDVPEGPSSAIISASVAGKFFGDDSPIGRQFRTRSGDTYDPPYTVVGVVEDAKYRALRETNSETIYLAASQEAADGRGGVTMLIRTAAGVPGIASSLRRAFAEIDGAITLQLSALNDQLADSLRRERVLALLSALFGSVALALSMLGLYGVTAYNVARRRNEIGVRIALGADGQRVLRMVLGDVARVVAVGVVLGIGGALASGKLVASFLYGMEPTEPGVMALSAALLALVALGAGIIPAWRASRVDPVTALREE